jgi:hypothetical protein
LIAAGSTARSAYRRTIRRFLTTSWNSMPSIIGHRQQTLPAGPTDLVHVDEAAAPDPRPKGASEQ